MHENPARWVYAEHASATEAKRRAAIEKKIDAWWKAFEGKTDQIGKLFLRKAEWDLPAWMDKHLQCLDQRIMWEYGPALSGEGHRLVITPESTRHLRPLTDAILARAPSIPGWEFYPYRPPEDLEMAQMSVQGRTGGDLSDLLVQASIGEHHRIDLTYFSPRAEEEGDEQTMSDAFVATETLLGEERLDKWVGAISAAPAPDGRKKKGMVTLDKLRERVDALVHQVRDQAPAKPLFKTAGDATWTLFKLEPEQDEEYACQFDLFVASAVDQDLWIACHSNTSFHSERFSKHGETFCYLKLDGSQGLDEEKFADKAEIEDALDAVLKPAKLGCHIGGGTGLRYSYIDLALTDVKKGIDAVVKRLREGTVPKRSWIQFFDDYLAAEWVGIYDDSPPPPMPLWE
ncbi:MAG: hypothetical protein FJ303_24390 [Planctomycetes bacterium]|nr:hypothetical protein [Planctomycetota bacterium]